MAVNPDATNPYGCWNLILQEFKRTSSTVLKIYVPWRSILAVKFINLVRNNLIIVFIFDSDANICSYL